MVKDSVRSWYNPFSQGVTVRPHLPLDYIKTFFWNELFLPRVSTAQRELQVPTSPGSGTSLLTTQIASVHLSTPKRPGPRTVGIEGNP